MILLLGSQVSIKVFFNPLKLEIEVNPGTSLLKAAQKANILMEADCDGKGRCGKCKVVVSKGVTVLTPREIEYLTPSELKKNVRLACQTFIQTKTSVFIPTVPNSFS